VTEHFGYHTGQIVYITKLKRGEDLKFWRLPVVKPPVEKVEKRELQASVPAGAART
jgi:hypothetical protein